MNYKFKILIILFSILVGLSILTCDKPSEPKVETPPQKLKIYINEFLASNKNVLADEAGQYDDWVEIYNDEDTTVKLQGYYLTDALNNPTKWTFPNVNIPPKGYLLIWCDNDTSQGILHANFKLSASGEQLGIFSPEKKIIDTLTYGEQKSDTSYGRFPDGSSNWKFMLPTPGSKNR